MKKILKGLVTFFLLTIVLTTNIFANENIVQRKDYRTFVDNVKSEKDVLKKQSIINNYFANFDNENYSSYTATAKSARALNSAPYPYNIDIKSDYSSTKWFRDKKSGNLDDVAGLGINIALGFTKPAIWVTKSAFDFFLAYDKYEEYEDGYTMTKNSYREYYKRVEVLDTQGFVNKNNWIVTAQSIARKSYLHSYAQYWTWSDEDNGLILKTGTEDNGAVLMEYPAHYEDDAYLGKKACEALQGSYNGYWSESYDDIGTYSEELIS